MTREETVSLLLHLLPPAKQGNKSDLRVALTEILETTSAAKVLALQYALQGMQKAKAERCAACQASIGMEQNKWALLDGTPVCQKCCVRDALIRLTEAIDNLES